VSQGALSELMVLLNVIEVSDSVEKIEVWCEDIGAG
jgi:hypothetical protein